MGKCSVPTGQEAEVASEEVEVDVTAKRKFSALARNQTLILCLCNLKPSYYSD
jgi:hypothetical protein